MTSIKLSHGTRRFNYMIRRIAVKTVSVHGQPLTSYVTRAPHLKLVASAQLVTVGPQPGSCTARSTPLQQSSFTRTTGVFLVYELRKST